MGKIIFLALVALFFICGAITMVMLWKDEAKAEQEQVAEE